MPDVLTVVERVDLGKRANRRLRETGAIPAVLYGHGEEAVSLVLRKEQLRTVLRHGGHVVDLQGAASGQALLQDLQWDTFGKQLLHVDLLRVSADEVVRLEVVVEMRGDAPGARGGGVVEQVMHEVEVEAAPAAIPERLHVDISGLELNGHIVASQIIDLPAGAKLVTPADTVLVHCVPAKGEPDVGSVVDAASEPERVGRKATQEEGAAG